MTAKLNEKETFERYFRRDKSDAWAWTGWALLPTIKADRTRKYKNSISVIYVHENGDETRAIMTQTRFNELVAEGKIEL